MQSYESEYAEFSGVLRGAPPIQFDVALLDEADGEYWESGLLAGHRWAFQEVLSGEEEAVSRALAESRRYLWMAQPQPAHGINACQTAMKYLWPPGLATWRRDENQVVGSGRALHPSDLPGLAVTSETHQGQVPAQPSWPSTTPWITAKSP
ncbi:uncharacterized protein BDR25DRAFT_363159 [Lindgomyces ingoldianus]|uniref:Uncharacterized protein n=1 Tax=Lindgomyces ingoldianus TaxID=673940 RepID=A0ACB6QAA4_9PLEO|nr:uncharacterized protein BDR25DRAFT_363159 [Lindgomyces ingoldianus]KAF2463071.1 hypothetical protein BDR25DRAFT_363159 [Lindgomyces ingoldianus]